MFSASPLARSLETVTLVKNKVVFAFYQVASRSFDDAPFARHANIKQVKQNYVNGTATRPRTPPAIPTTPEGLPLAPGLYGGFAADKPAGKKAGNKAGSGKKAKGKRDEL